MNIEQHRFSALIFPLLLVVLAISLLGCSSGDQSELPLLQSEKIDSGTENDWYIRRYGDVEKETWKSRSEVEASVSIHSEHDHNTSAHSAHGMYELTQYPNIEATARQKLDALAWRERAEQAAIKNGWLDIKKARQDGFFKMYNDNIHFANRKFLYDDELINPEKPEFLMFYETEYGPMLMGVMFVAETQGPQFAGPLTIWHYHIEENICYERGILPITQFDENGKCLEGRARDKSPEMVHVWFFDHPEGPFATRMKLTDAQFVRAVEQVSEIYRSVGLR